MDTIIVNKTIEAENFFSDLLGNSRVLEQSADFSSLVDALYKTIREKGKTTIAIAVAELANHYVVILGLNLSYPLSAGVCREISQKCASKALLILDVQTAAFYGINIFENGKLLRKLVYLRGEALENEGRPQPFESSKNGVSRAKLLEGAFEHIGLDIYELNLEGKYRILDATGSLPGN